jgi:hypothetical protein
VRDISQNNQLLGLWPLIPCQNQGALQFGQRIETITNMRLERLMIRPPTIKIAVKEFVIVSAVLIHHNTEALPKSGKMNDNLSFQICRVFLTIELSNIYFHPHTTLFFMFTCFF